MEDNKDFMDLLKQLKESEYRIEELKRQVSEANEKKGSGDYTRLELALEKSKVEQLEKRLSEAVELLEGACGYVDDMAMNTDGYSATKEIEKFAEQIRAFIAEHTKTKDNEIRNS